MIRHIARLAAIVLVAVGGVVACSEDTPVCAAPIPAANNPRPVQPPKANPPKVNQPGQQRTTSKVQDKTQTGKQDKAKTTTNPAWKSSTKPTAWSGYNPNSRDWSKPYRKGHKPAPQPVIINQYGHDYRTYPGYGGYYPVGVWPIGYGATYGCVAEREDDAEETPR